MNERRWLDSLRDALERGTASLRRVEVTERSAAGGFFGGPAMVVAEIEWREAFDSPAPRPARTCTTCNDTHRMNLGERVVSCTHCPVPCEQCRSGGLGAYCEVTPCACPCHAKR